MPTRRNGPVSSNVSHHECRIRSRMQYRYRSLWTKQGFLMIEKIGNPNTATLVERCEECPLFALRAVAQSASPVQQPAARSAAGRVRSALARFGGAGKTGSFSGARSALKVGPRVSNTERRLLRRHFQARQPKTRKHTLSVVAFFAASKSNSVNGIPSSGSSVRGVLANPSLNRTHCSVPSFGL